MNILHYIKCYKFNDDDDDDDFDAEFYKTGRKSTVKCVQTENRIVRLKMSK